MKKLITLLLAAPVLALGATLAPIQLLNPAGSTTGQAIVSTGSSSAPTWGSVGLNGITDVPANTVLANATNASTKPAAFSMPSCSTSSSALNYTSGTGIGCNSSINASSLGGTAAAAYALLASPAFTGTPTAPTAAPGTNTTQLATTAFVANRFAPLASPALTGTPTAPTAAAGTNTTQIATTAFAQNAVTGGGNAGSFTTVAASGLISPTSSIGIKATSTNDNAQAGSVGEFPTPSNLTNVSLTSGTAANGSSISVGPGDWDIVGTCQFLPAGSTTISSVIAAVNSTSATLPGAPNETAIQAALTAGAQQIISTPPARVQPTSTTTYYTVCQAAFGTSTMAVNGYIRARRPR
ncbi:hypothetical protein [Burkholderia contaminans]|uniref:hypothetical protein n=1 Tax=Burkholderia contaminans TaxID=488447 RepID=UPI0015820968|nr:hypothetical protein [Burkholderia contaminans]